MKAQDYTISETFSLPSAGALYGISSPLVTLRSMTTQEEMKRLSPSDLPYKNMCEIIDDCIVDEISISSYDMCMADYQFLLQKLRIVTYGKDYNLTSTCPYCGCTNKDILDLTTLVSKEYSEDVRKYLEIDLPQSKTHVTLGLQSPRCIDSATYNTKEYKKRTDTKIDQTPVFMLQELITMINGEAPNKLHLADWIRKLPMRDTNILLASVDRANKSFGINLTLHCVCDLCGVEYNTILRGDREFFRPSLVF